MDDVISNTAPLPTADASASTKLVLTADDKEVKPTVSNFVRKWTDRIKAARSHWKDDFDRMRQNMQFVAGYQWNEQEKMDDDRYVANLTLKLVNQKVSQLYARNPKVVPQRKQRMDFQIWDEKMESLQQAAAMTSLPEADEAHKMMGMALMTDFTQGRQLRDVIDKVAKTLKLVFAWNMESMSPTFKTQMKQLVRQTIVTGVGYVRLDFMRSQEENPLTTTSSDTTTGDRMKQAQHILDKYKRGEITEESPEITELATLFHSLQAYEDERQDVQERLVFDFPPSTSIIPDPRCRNLKGFVGAHWIAQEYVLPVEAVNAHFGSHVSIGNGVQEYTEQSRQVMETTMDSAQDDTTKLGAHVCLWQVFDLDTKSHFFIVDGHNNFLQEPEPVYPETKHFWPVFALTFNDTVVEEGQKATIFPPSDVQLVKSPQKEHNRSRQSLREHRKANTPKYATGKGWLTQNDKDKLVNALPSEVIEVEGAQPGADINKLIVPFNHASIDPALYDSTPVTQDMFHTFGNDEATEPASIKGTATAATINEQSRVATTSSNVDDLDDFLSAIAESGGEILLRECSHETVSRIAGPGAVWPEADRIMYIDLIYLEVAAASSGRPNKALEISNFQQLAPLLLQAAANPMLIQNPIYRLVVKEAIKRLDDRIDLDEIFAIGMSMQQPPQGAPTSSAQPSQGAQGAGHENKFPTHTQPQGRMQRPVVGQ